MNSNKIYTLLNAHLPAASLEYCFTLWEKYPFAFKITPKRNSKLGDYRYNYQQKVHRITVNKNLNRYSFLITYIHELAHLVTFQKYGHGEPPHGGKWKRNFRLLLAPVMNENVFPPDILEPLENYMKNPLSSSCNHYGLSKALHRYDDQEGLVHLSHISLNEKFRFNDRVFTKEKLRRKRSLCKENKTGKRYLVSEIALVEAL